MAEQAKCPEFGTKRDLEFGKERADASHITGPYIQKFWSGTNVLYDKERELILEKIKETVNEWLSSKKGSKITMEELKDKWNDLKNKIEFYTRPKEEHLENIKGKDKFISEFLNKSFNPRMFMILFALTAIFEILVILVQAIGLSLSEGEVDFTVVSIAVGQGLLLALGGWVLGEFFGRWFIDKRLQKEGIVSNRTGLIHYFYLVVGISIILFISTVRALAGGGAYAFIITLILGLLATAFKGAWKYSEELKCEVGNLKVSYFHKLASEGHAKNMDIYEERFFIELREHAKKYNVSIEEG